MLFSPSVDPATRSFETKLCTIGRRGTPTVTASVRPSWVKWQIATNFQPTNRYIYEKKEDSHIITMED